LRLFSVIINGKTISFVRREVGTMIEIDPDSMREAGGYGSQRC
jgi:hypothetical protein